MQREEVLRRDGDTKILASRDVSRTGGQVNKATRKTEKKRTARRIPGDDKCIVKNGRECERDKSMHWMAAIVRGSVERLPQRGGGL